MRQKGIIRIVHELPNRIRFWISLAFEDWEEAKKDIVKHDGILGLSHSPVSKSVLVSFNPKLISREETIIRIALSLSSQHGNIAIQTFNETAAHSLDQTAYYSGFGLLLATLLKLLAPRMRILYFFEMGCGLFTALSVTKHAYGEAKIRGRADPEILSAIYLLVSFLRGHFLKASTITWLTTFARHLLQFPVRGIEIQPTFFNVIGKKMRSHEILISPIREMPQGGRWFHLLPSAIKLLFTSALGLEDALFKEMRKVIRSHGKKPEGLTSLHEGILTKFGFEPDLKDDKYNFYKHKTIRREVKYGNLQNRL